MACKQYTAKEIESIIRKDGWYLTRICGSHYHYKHPNKTGTVRIPFHAGKTLKPGTLHEIFKSAQIDKALYV